MLSLNEYKNYLINTYRWPIDNSADLILKRKRILEEKYGDEFLSKVITDTYDFARSVLTSNTINSGYYRSAVSGDTTSYINLGLHGGWMSDTLYVDSNGRYISNFVIKTIFGRDVLIELRIEECEREVEDEIFTFDYDYSIYMQGISKDLDKIRQDISNNEMKLTRNSNYGISN